MTNELTELRAAARYVCALSVLFPHVNTDRKNEQLGVPDTDGWCLGCSVMSTFEEYAKDIMDTDDDDQVTINAEAARREYEQREMPDASRYVQTEFDEAAYFRWLDEEGELRLEIERLRADNEHLIDKVAAAVANQHEMGFEVLPLRGVFRAAKAHLAALRALPRSDTQATIDALDAAVSNVDELDALRSAADQEGTAVDADPEAPS